MFGLVLVELVSAVAKEVNVNAPTAAAKVVNSIRLIAVVFLFIFSTSVLQKFNY